MLYLLKCCKPILDFGWFSGRRTCSPLQNGYQPTRTCFLFSAAMIDGVSLALLSLYSISLAGNDHIHRLSQTNQKFSVNLESADKVKYMAEYATFYINNETDNYRLTVRPGILELCICPFLVQYIRSNRVACMRNYKLSWFIWLRT